jgi:serine/threonine protein kinase
MAYVEVRKNGKVVKRSLIEDDKAHKGCRIRVGSLGQVHLEIGQTKTIGKYEISMLEGVPEQGHEALDQSKTESDAFPSISQTEQAEFTGPVRVRPADRDSLYPKIEGYEITSRLGQGGMGTVWRAVELSTKREVALKFLGSHRFASQKSRARFEREVSLAAKLTHPNIARVYHSGLYRGVYYYAMELVDGIHLDKYVQQNELSQREILELMKEVCDAIRHAHEQGIIHRDLKPSNILVTKDDKPHVVDFGLAKASMKEEGDVTISIDGEITGTLAYMSPEQAAGRLDQIGEQTDVYSLGVILYQLLTGRLPHDVTGSRYDVIKRIVEGQVENPTDYAEHIDADLESLLLTSLAKEPHERYPSATVLFQDIGNYLNGEPLFARSLSATYRIRKRVHKHAKPIAVTSALVTIIAVIIAGSLYLVHSERKRRQSVEKIVMGLEAGTQAKNQEPTEIPKPEPQLEQGSSRQNIEPQKAEQAGNTLSLRTLLSERSDYTDSELAAGILISQLEQIIRQKDWLEALDVYEQLETKHSQTSEVSNMAEQLAGWKREIQNGIISNKVQYDYEVMTRLEEIRGRIGQKNYLLGGLLLADLKKRYAGLGILEKYAASVRTLENQIEPVLENLHVEDNPTYYLNRQVDANDPIWDKAMDPMGYGRVQDKKNGYCLLRIFLEHGMSSQETVGVMGMDDTVVYQGGGYSRSAGLSNGGVFVLGSYDYRGYNPSQTEVTNEKKIAKIRISSPTHYHTELTIPYETGKKTIFGDVIVKQVPRVYRGTIQVKLNPEEDLDLTDVRVIVGPGGSSNQTDANGLYVFDSLAPGGYTARIDNQNRFSSTYKSCNLKAGQTEIIEIDVYKMREVVLDWRFFDSRQERWLKGTQVMKTRSSWSPREAWGGVNYPVIDVSEWDRHGCTLDDVNGDLALVQWDIESFETMSFPDQLLGTGGSGNYPIVPGKIFAWSRKERKKDGDKWVEYYLKALFKIREIRVVEEPPDATQKSQSTRILQPRRSR